MMNLYHPLERHNRGFVRPLSYRIKNKKQFMIMVWSSTSKLTLEETSFYEQVCGTHKNIQYPICGDAALPARWSSKTEVEH